MRCSLPSSGFSLALLLAAGLRVEATVFELFQLPEAVHPHPQPYCNDGSQAGYYHDTDYSKLARVHVHLQVGCDWLTLWSRDSMLTSDWATPNLQGGNLCDSDESCLYRCDEDGDGVVDGGLCKEPSLLQIIQFFFYFLV